MKKLFAKKLRIPVLSQLLGSLKAITWPSFKDVVKSLFAVLLISVIIGAYLSLLDTAFGEFRNFVLFK